MKLELTLLRASPGHASALTDIALASKRHWDYPERWIAGLDTPVDDIA